LDDPSDTIRLWWKLATFVSPYCYRTRQEIVPKVDALGVPYNYLMMMMMLVWGLLSLTYTPTVDRWDVDDGGSAGGLGGGHVG
jgi:hypothetical protein